MGQTLIFLPTIVLWTESETVQVRTLREVSDRALLMNPGQLLRSYNTEVSVFSLRRGSLRPITLVFQKGK